MKHKIFGMFLVVSIILNLMTTVALADYTLPSSFGAPSGLSVSYYEAHEGNYMGFYATVTASDDLRAFVDDVGADNSAFSDEGYSLDEIALQLDFKTAGGDWHANDDWNTNFTLYKSSIRIEKGVYTTSTCYTADQIQQITPNEKIPESTTYFDSNTWQFRARFMVVSQGKDGNYYTALSPWCAPFSFSNKKIVEDPDKLINHAPVLKSASVRTYSDGRPYLQIVSDKPHPDVTHLNTITTNSVNTEVWIKVGNGEWKLCNFDGNFVEEFNVDAISSYFGNQDSYDAAVYQAKMRYKFDYVRYPEAGKSGIIYSPFSNIISHGLSAYSNASNWAKAELGKADSFGLIPEILKGADMTKPITREEFCELAERLYEKTTGKTSDPISPNPFNDTTNPEILKAFKLGITSGTSATTFSPQILINREQCASMLFRTIKAINPGGDYSISGVKDFPDQKDISGWAVEATKYMSMIGIVSGDSKGSFMPKATTTVQQAAGYGMATREQAIAMSVRTYEKFK